MEILHGGGAVICGCTAWGWMSKNANKLISEFPFSQFCNTLGVKLTKNYYPAPNPIPHRPELIEYKNIQSVIEELSQNPNAKGLYAIAGAAVKELDGSVSGLPTQLLESMVANTTQEVIPAHKRPVKDEKCREQSRGLCYMLAGLPGIKALGSFVYLFNYLYFLHFIQVWITFLVISKNHLNSRVVLSVLSNQVHVNGFVQVITSLLV